MGAVAGSVILWTAPLLLFSVLGGVALGIVLADIYLRASARRKEGPAQIILPFVCCCGAWLLADSLELSAVLTIVSSALTFKTRRIAVSASATAVTPHGVWAVVLIFILNVLAFVLVGLRLPALWNGCKTCPSLLYSPRLSFSPPLARLAWVMTHATIMRRLDQGRGQSSQPLEAGLIAWCGLRGIVTEAAALPCRSSSGTVTSLCSLPFPQCSAH